MKHKILLLATSALVLAGCSDDDDKYSALHSYTISVTNLTPNQPMSPLLVLNHNSSYELFSLNQSASVPLEHLAESGSTEQLLALTDSNANVYYGESGSGIITPGSGDSVTITIDPYKAGYLSVASMLVNTNDAFIGETGLSVKSLAVGESYQMNMNVWDAGTELNDELAASIPGPAGGGEGYNGARNDDRDAVTIHPGVISQDDGLATSVLTSSHRFLNPGAKLIITRTE